MTSTELNNLYVAMLVLLIGCSFIAGFAVGLAASK